jgi:hypothetical protein
MQPPEHHPGDNKLPKQRKDYSLFFFEQQGNRSYLRFTPLGVTVILLLIAVPLILILILYFVNSQNLEDIKINTNISVQSPTPYTVNRTIIPRPTPVPALPKVRQPQIKVPEQPLNEPPINNTNEGKPARTPRAIQNSNSNSSANYK